MTEAVQLGLELATPDAKPLYDYDPARYWPTFENAWARLFGSYRPPPSLTISQYADTYGRLGAGTADAGRWTCLPYQTAILDAFSEPQIDWVVFQKSSQLGWTKILGFVFSYYADLDPAPMLLVQPTVEDAQEYSKEEIAELIADNARLYDVFGDPKSRSSNQTILSKRANNGAHLVLVGANSPRGFRRITRRIVLCDEISGYPPSAGQEGDQIALAATRAAKWWNRKIGLGSTPTVRGICRVEKELAETQKGFYMLFCPHCGQEHVRRLRAGGYSGEPWRLGDQELPESVLSWPKGKPNKAAWACPGCAGLIEHSMHHELMAGGYWRGEGWRWTHEARAFEFEPEFRGRIGFHCWTGYGYGPSSTPAAIADQFLRAKRDSGTLRSYVNTCLGETFEEKTHRISHRALLARRELFPAQVPRGGLVLTAGVDVQPDRFEMEVVAWNQQGESWSVDYLVIPCETSRPVGTEPGWIELRRAIGDTYEHELGGKLKISMCLIDSGYLSGQVFAFVISLGLDWVRASKGMDGARPITEPRDKRRERLLRRKAAKGTAKPELIGTEEAKIRIFQSLTVDVPGPGYVHVPMDREEEYFLQLTGEMVQYYYMHGRPIRKLVQTRERVEALDCRVLALAALTLVKVDWAELRRALTKGKGREKSKPRPTEKRAPAARRGWGSDDWSERD